MADNKQDGKGPKDTTIDEQVNTADPGANDPEDSVANKESDETQNAANETTNDEDHADNDDKTTSDNEKATNEDATSNTQPRAKKNNFKTSPRIFYVQGYGNVGGCKTQEEAEKKALKLINQERQ